MCNRKKIAEVLITALERQIDIVKNAKHITFTSDDGALTYNADDDMYLKSIFEQAQRRTLALQKDLLKTLKGVE